MRQMPNIKLTEEEVKMLLLVDAQRYGEAFICNFRSEHTLYKIFYQEDISETEDYDDEECIQSLPRIEDIVDMSDNKLKKLEELYQLQLEHSVMPVSTLSMNGRLIGYEMTRDCNDIALNPRFLRRRELIHFLEQSKNILQYFASKNIIYGDVANRNILVNRKTKTVKFCDMDNICLGQYPIDKMGWELSAYCESCGGLNAQADAYMHNLMTIIDLGIDISVDSLTKACFNRNFLPQASLTFEEMLAPETFNGEYIIQYVKK